MTIGEYPLLYVFFWGLLCSFALGGCSSEEGVLEGLLTSPYDLCPVARLVPWALAYAILILLLREQQRRLYAC